MRNLPTTYRKGGFDYTLLTANGTVCCYRQDESGTTVGYEVCHIIHRPESTRVMGGKTITTEAGEYLPSTEQWGSKAWTHKTLEAAEKRYHAETDRLLEKAKQKEVEKSDL
jgi:hypothetical protein